MLSRENQRSGFFLILKSGVFGLNYISLYLFIDIPRQRRRHVSWKDWQWVKVAVEAGQLKGNGPEL